MNGEQNQDIVGLEKKWEHLIDKSAFKQRRSETSER
jgi:hypothetical protein